MDDGITRPARITDCSAFGLSIRNTRGCVGTATSAMFLAGRSFLSDSQSPNTRFNSSVTSASVVSPTTMMRALLART